MSGGAARTGSLPHDIVRSTPQGASMSTLLRLLPALKPVIWRYVAGLSVGFAATGLGLAIPQVIRALVDGPISAGRDSGSSRGVWVAAGIVLALGVLQAAMWYSRRMLLMGPMVGVEHRLRTSLFDHLLDLSVSFHDHWESGQLLSRASTDLSRIRRWLSFGSILLVVNVTTAVVGIVILIALSPPLGGIFALFAIPTAWLSLRFQLRYRVLTRRGLDQAGALATEVEESVQGIRVITAFGRSGEFADQFMDAARRQRDTEIGKARSLSGIRMWLSLLPQLAFAVCLAAGVWLVRDGALSLGDVVAFFGTAAFLLWPVRSLGFAFADVMDATAATARVFEVLDTAPDVTDPVDPIEDDPDPSRIGELLFDDVHVGYGDREVLAGVDLRIAPGETVALVGATGSGKTVMVELVPRFMDVTGGAVRVGGVDVRDMTRQRLRGQLGMAFEAPQLFSGTVRENVLVGCPDADADQLDEALAIAQAGFVYDLPDGVDTVIGEEGQSLSGGQRQRLALARAIAAEPRILVLDDPLSALDVNTEALVEASLRRVLQGVTALIVAHRPSTVALADRVAVLRDGRIVATGRHDELLRSDPYYRQLMSLEVTS
ncbi:ABC transporter ATP-binding protein [Pseudoclavibacter sp. CFCC 13796]|uniref:ABC transporter ATP-binding protein n=1 Tax=Pseudoclavibacter sp. CFCC 13796 TaxID=2615179 RepID=UPI001301113C|nr:ABC transporter ATP-binding protein [Pseudoclavibacter sp. CFCC 13796]KAB1659876.1 ABC transporter ATP-binding protein [Pseudoclavibacter sp. CFCC 13796]